MPQMAGPPYATTPSLRKASATSSRLRFISVMAFSLTVRGRIPGVDLVLAALAPRVERVVHHHAVLEHLVVVRVLPREPQRDCREAARLRREIQPRGVRAAHDDCELRERGI